MKNDFGTISSELLDVPNQRAAVDGIFAEAAEEAGKDRSSAKLLEDLVIEYTLLDDKIKALKEEQVASEKILEAMGEKIHHLFHENGSPEGKKFASGIFMKPTEKERVFKAAGVPTEEVVKWLRGHGLGDIVIDYVPHASLTSNMLTFRALNGGSAIPKIFNFVTKQGVKFQGNGRKNFLRAYYAAQEAQVDQPEGADAPQTEPSVDEKGPSIS